ncbi:MAG TPA: lysozyme [Phenylobacterium sp.]|nr:lysozyme [Phenylobacterium sp.]
MQPRHQVSRAAIELIKTFEGYRRQAARLADGRWTIGYSHTLTAREGAEVSESDAEALLIYDLISVSHLADEWIYTPLSQNQFDAVCAFAFSIGTEAFRGSAVLRRINEGQLLQAACAMELWRKADFEGERIVIDALVRRRAAEKALFLTPTHGWMPAPSPVLRPRIDYDVQDAVPLETPTVLTTSLEGAEALAEREPLPAPPPTATERAAAAVTQRLQSIFPDADEDERVAVPAYDEPADSMPEPIEGPAAASAEGGEEFEHQPVAEMRDEPGEPGRSPFDSREPELGVSDMDAIDLSLPVDAPAPHSRPQQRDLAPLLGLGGLGLVFFIGGLIWSGGAPGGAGAFNPWIVGTLVCLAGVGFMAVAVYLLLLRLARLDHPASPSGADGQRE